MFKFTLTITTSVFLFMSGAADLFAMDHLDDDNKALATIHHIPQEVRRVILTETSKAVNPRCLTPVCKLWYNTIRENQDVQGKELHYSDMNPFMKDLMRTYWESRFYKGVLEYTSPNDGKKIKLRFLDLKDKDGTFNLSICEDASNYLVITINSDRFFEIGGENRDKAVTGIVPYHWIEQIIKSKPDHPLASFMAGWDPDIAPVGMFWRWGTDKDLTWVDYHTTATMNEISSKNLYENWRAREADGLGARCGVWVVETFSCQFLNQNKN